MGSDPLQFFWIFTIFVAALFTIGFYYILFTFNLIRLLIGIEIVTKAVTLFIILAGHVTGRTALAQALVITMIVVEVVVITIAAGVVIGIFRQNSSLDTRRLRNLRG